MIAVDFQIYIYIYIKVVWGMIAVDFQRQW